MLFHWDPPTSSKCIFFNCFFLNSLLIQMKGNIIFLILWLNKFLKVVNIWVYNIVPLSVVLALPLLNLWAAEHPGLWFPTSSWIASIQRTLLDQHSTVLNLDLGVHCHGRVGENQEPRGCKNHLTGDKFFKTINTSLICKPRECSRVSTGAEILLRMQMISNTLTLKK